MKKIIIIVLIIAIIIASITLIFFIMPKDTVLTYYSSETLNIGNNYEIGLSEKSNNQPIKNHMVYVDFINSNGQTTSFKGKTNENGILSIPLNNINSGSYTVKIKSNGNLQHKSISATHQISITDKIEQTTVQNNGLTSKNGITVPDSYNPSPSFAGTDSNNDGYVTYRDMNLAHTPENIGMQIFNDADLNSDGKLTSSEYKIFMYLLNEKRDVYGLEKIVRTT